VLLSVRFRLGTWIVLRAGDASEDAAPQRLGMVDRAVDDEPELGSEERLVLDPAVVATAERDEVLPGCRTTLALLVEMMRGPRTGTGPGQMGLPAEKTGERCDLASERQGLAVLGLALR
jgi:hypothetical protein